MTKLIEHATVAYFEVEKNGMLKCRMPRLDLLSSDLKGI